MVINSLVYIRNQDLEFCGSTREHGGGPEKSSTKRQRQTNDGARWAISNSPPGPNPKAEKTKEASETSFRSLSRTLSSECLLSPCEPQRITARIITLCSASSMDTIPCPTPQADCHATISFAMSTNWSQVARPIWKLALVSIQKGQNCPDERFPMLISHNTYLPMMPENSVSLFASTIQLRNQNRQCCPIHGF
jgi:hypothetical protein